MLLDGAMPRSLSAEIACRTEAKWMRGPPVDRRTSPAEAEPGARLAWERLADDESVKDDVEPSFCRLGYVDGTYGAGCTFASLPHTTVASEQCPRLHKSAAECHFCRLGAVSAHRRGCASPLRTRKSGRHRGWHTACFVRAA